MPGYTRWPLHVIHSVSFGMCRKSGAAVGYTSIDVGRERHFSSASPFHPLGSSCLVTENLTVMKSICLNSNDRLTNAGSPTLQSMLSN